MTTLCGSFSNGTSSAFRPNAGACSDVSRRNCSLSDLRSDSVKKLNKDVPITSSGALLFSSSKQELFA